MTLRKPAVLTPAGCILVLLAGCAGQGLSAFGSSDTLDVQGRFKPAPVPDINTRHPVYLLIKPYNDTRPGAPSRKIGVVGDETFVSNLSGRDVVLNEDVTALVTQAMQHQLQAAGYHVVRPGESDAGEASLALTGTVKTFRLDVKGRDQVDMQVQTDVHDARTDAVIWSGTVKESSDRFGGVTGDSRGSLVDYLMKSLRNVTRKTTAAVTASLSQAYPDLFMQAGSPMPGVSVQTAPAPAQGVPSGAPAVPGQAAPAGAAAAQAQGTLSVTTEPDGAEVYLGDVYYGLSPIEVQAPAGIYTVRVDKGGYAGVTQKIAVRPGKTTPWDIRLHAK